MGGRMRSWGLLAGLALILAGCVALPPKSGFIIGAEQWQYPTKEEVGYVVADRVKYIEGLADSELYLSREDIQKVSIDHSGFSVSYTKDEFVETKSEEKAFAIGPNGNWAAGSGKGKSQQVLQRDKRSMILWGDIKGIYLFRGVERLRDKSDIITPGKGHNYCYLLLATEGRKPIWFSSKSINVLARVAYAFSELTHLEIRTDQAENEPVYAGIGLILNKGTSEVEGIFEKSPFSKAIKIGDYVLAVDSNSLCAPVEVMRNINNLQEGNHFLLVADRKDCEIKRDADGTWLRFEGRFTSNGPSYHKITFFY